MPDETPPPPHEDPPHEDPSHEYTSSPPLPPSPFTRSPGPPEKIERTPRPTHRQPPPRREDEYRDSPPRERQRATPTPRETTERPSRAHEHKVHGKNACLAVFHRRPADIIRAYLTESAAKGLGDLMKFCAIGRRAYHIVDASEMEKISATIHHEGVCLLVKALPTWSVDDFLASTRKLETCCVVALDEVGNPHNLGALMRVATHFAARAVLTPDTGALQSGAAMRTAQGGAEYLDLVGCDSLPAAVSAFHRAGFRILTTSSHEGIDLFAATLPPRCIIILGSEARGLHPALLRVGDSILRIPGTGRVESLNVATAASVILGKYWHQHGEKARKTDA